MLPWQPIRFINLDKIHMNHRGLHISVKQNLNISETAKIATFHFSHNKSTETTAIATRVLKKHNYSFPRPIYATCKILLRIGFMASEEMSSENVDG